jgi:hypothetical protein
MPVTYEPDITVPDVDALASGDGPSFRRILVPIRLAGDAAETLTVAARVCRPANGVVRLLHVRLYDPPLRNSGRFYPPTADEAAAVLDEALLLAWGYGLRATTAVVAAPRGKVAAGLLVAPGTGRAGPGAEVEGQGQSSCLVQPPPARR